MRKLIQILAFTLLLGIAGGVWWWSNQPVVEKAGSPVGTVQEMVTNRPLEVQQDQYVGSCRCQDCHEQEYRTWHQSYHRTMTQLATSENVLGDFNDVMLKHDQGTYFMVREGGRFFVDLPGKGRGGLREKRPVVMVTGRHHMQFYWYDSGEGRAVGELPFVWLVPEQQWVSADATFLKPPDSYANRTPGFWNHNCISCHTTHGQPQLALNPNGVPIGPAAKMETTVAEFGIACEACHGPGEAHVELQIAAQRVKDINGDDAPLVVPDELPEHLSSQVCGRCHSVTVHRRPAHLAELLTTGANYEPGDDLFDPEKSNLVVYQQSIDAAYRQAVKNLPPDFHGTRFWSDGMTRISGREYNGLIESPCYLHQDPDKGIMSCMTCHEMHPASEDEAYWQQWADDQLKPGMRGDRACLSCHEAFKQPDVLVAHTHHFPGSSGSLCYNCHMPYTTYGLLKGIRSHQVSSPSMAATLETGRPLACNQCHLDKSLAWSASRLSEWYAHDVPSLTRDQQQVAASFWWTLTGDAGQRALMAWSFGWDEALVTSGTTWQVPYLAQMLLDPYEAIRIVALRSLVQQPGFANIPLRHDLTAQERFQLSQQVIHQWEDQAPGPDRPALLIRKGNQLDRDRVNGLLEKRDHRPVTLHE